MIKILQKTSSLLMIFLCIIFYLAVTNCLVKAEDLLHVSSFAEREGQRITLHPYGARFSVPEAWVKWHEQEAPKYTLYGNNFFLSRAELEKVKDLRADSKSVVLGVINSMLPFEHCAAQILDEGWARMQRFLLRAYVIPLNLERSITQIFNDEGPRVMESTLKRDIYDLHVERLSQGNWNSTNYQYNRWNYDYITVDRIDFWYRKYPEFFLVFVFEYSREPSNETGKIINEIINSVELEER